MAAVKKTASRKVAKKVPAKKVATKSARRAGPKKGVLGKWPPPR